LKHVFVSYKSEDRERVRNLVEGLRRTGVPIWWDQDIPPGAVWEESILQALEESECVLVCWTQRSTHPKDGAKVQVEAREALDNERLVQVLLDDSDPPLFFRQFQAADLRKWDGSSQHPGFQSIAQAAKDILAGKAPAKFQHVGKKRRLERWLFVAAAVALMAAATPSLFNIINQFATSANNAHIANTRQDIRLLRIGSPFDDAKPPLTPPRFDDVLASAPELSVESTTSAGLHEAIAEAQERGLEPELFAFDNYGIFEVSADVPYRSTTIREALPNSTFVEIVGPMAERIQDRGWVFLNFEARNAEKVIDLALQQQTCSGDAEVALDRRAEKALQVAAQKIEGQVRVDLCRIIDHGSLLFASVDAIIQTSEQIGLVSYTAIIEAEDGALSISILTNDTVTACLLSPDIGQDDCFGSFDDISNSIQVPLVLPDRIEGLGQQPVVQLTSPVEMVNLVGTDNAFTWSDFTWQTSAPSEIAYQLVIFDMGGLERVFAVSPAEQAKVSSGSLMGGDDSSRWRVVSVLPSGKVTSTDWQKYYRVDQLPSGKRVRRG
jgi:hypothetical protein